MMADQRDRLDRQAVGLMLVFCTLWGLQHVAIKLATPGIPPVWQATIRSLGATLLVFAWARLRRVPLDLRDGTLLPGLAAGLLFAGEFALLYLALRYTTASRGVLFLYTAPFIVSIGAVLLLPAESMRRMQWFGMFLAFGGVVTLFGENLRMPAGEAWIGDLMMLAAALLWAATTLTIKTTALARAPAEKTLLYQLAVSVPLLGGLALAMGEAMPPAPSTLVWGSMLFQTVVVASFSYLGWFWLIRHYPATRLSSFSFLTPVMGVLAGVLVLGEPLSAGIAAALTMVGGGIWLANRPAAGTLTARR